MGCTQRRGPQPSEPMASKFIVAGSLSGRYNASRLLGVISRSLMRDSFKRGAQKEWIRLGSTGVQEDRLQKERHKESDGQATRD